MDVPLRPARSDELTSIWERYLTGTLTPADETLLAALLEDLEHEIRDTVSESQRDGDAILTRHAAPRLDERARNGVDIDAVLRELER